MRIARQFQGQRSGLEAGRGIPCRPNLVAALLVSLVFTKFFFKNLCSRFKKCISRGSCSVVEYWYTVQVGQTRTCFSFIADRWYPVANTSIDHLIKIQEYAETGNSCSAILATLQVTLLTERHVYLLQLFWITYIKVLTVLVLLYLLRLSLLFIFLLLCSDYGDTITINTARALYSLIP